MSNERRATLSEAGGTARHKEETDTGDKSDSRRERPCLAEGEDRRRHRPPRVPLHRDLRRAAPAQDDSDTAARLTRIRRRLGYGGGGCERLGYGGGCERLGYGGGVAPHLDLLGGGGPAQGAVGRKGARGPEEARLQRNPSREGRDRSVRVIAEPRPRRLRVGRGDVTWRVRQAR